MQVNIAFKAQPHRAYECSGMTHNRHLNAREHMHARVQSVSYLVPLAGRNGKAWQGPDLELLLSLNSPCLVQRNGTRDCDVYTAHLHGPSVAKLRHEPDLQWLIDPIDV